MSCGRRSSNVILLVFLASIGVFVADRNALAWGRLGHRAAGRLAESRLSDQAKAAVRGLLNPNESLADASTWADEVRREFPQSGPWHYVNVPITEAHFDAGFCPQSGCVVSKIGEFRKVIADRSLPRDERRLALRFLVHFVEDMHQPLHVGDNRDKGGNDTQVQFFGQGSNLHKVWDSGLIEHAYKDEVSFFNDVSTLAASPDAASWANGTVESWADESLQLAKSAYTRPESEAPLRSGSKLGDAYQVIHLPRASRRVAQSGVRLARILNESFQTP